MGARWRRRAIPKGLRMLDKAFREEVHNLQLARLLAQQGIVSFPETIDQNVEGARRMPDVLVEFQGLRTIIEGKVDDKPGAKENVHNDAYRRVSEGLAHIGIAVLYPAELRKAMSARHLCALIESKILQIEVITEFGSEGWTRARVADLGDILRRTFEQLAAQDLVSKTAASLEAAVSEFARSIIGKDAIIQRGAEILGIGEMTIEGDERRQRKFELQWRESVAKIGGLTILNAMIFHEVLSQAEKRVNPIAALLEAVNPMMELRREWSKILLIDYQPIFGVAIGLLDTLPSNADTINSLLVLGERAMEVLANRTSMKHDLMGRVYHTLLADKKYLGTYYTSVPAATMLLKVALAGKTWPMDWSSVDEIGALRVGDLACGTGTLLMAAYEALTDNYIHACFKNATEPDLSKSHQAVMEKVLYGYDVLPSALHLTASTLALRSASVLFKRMNLFNLPHGGKEGRLGSIEYLYGPNQIPMDADIFRSGALQVTGEGDQKVDGEHMLAPLPKLDLCVINPPFTRSVGGNLLFGSSPEKERRQMQDKLARLLREKKIQASSTAGLGAVFVAIADMALKLGGKLALVLPKTLLSGVAWEKTRKLLAEKYIVETIIVSHDPERWNFSDNTDLSEVLLVARKVGNGNNNRCNDRVKCVNLWKNPETVFSSLITARQIIEEDAPDIETGQVGQLIEMGERTFGELSSVSWNDLKDRLWIAPFAFAQLQLTKCAWNLLKVKAIPHPHSKIPITIPLSALSKLGIFGPDARDIHDGFQRSKIKTLYPALLDHDADDGEILSREINGYLRPLSKAKPGRTLRKVVDLWPLSGRLQISERLRMNTQKTIAVRLNKEALSNVWWPFQLKVENEAHEKAIVLWLNSSLGLMSLLAIRNETQGAWMKFKKPNLESLPVLDVRALSETQLKILSDAFDEVANEPLLPFPQMEHDPIRAKIDKAVSKALGLPDLGVYRMLLAQEPVVCLKGLY